MNSQEILNTYLDFYKEKGHALIPNMSLIPENDPTLLFVNSGMFPLVNYLSGQAHPLGKRLVNVQRCLRFDDLEDIGDYNHTIAFHMIGNWSLGDYFKKEQLPWVYELYIEKFKLDPQRIYATVFAGDEDAPKDEKSIEILKSVFKKYGIDAKEGERIFAYGKKDNWWKRGDAIGELGGPDSEMFYYIGDIGSTQNKNPADNEDEFLEIGNSVFMQYKKSDSGWEELTQKNVDFGGGLERIAMVIQGKTDIYETDNFWPIIEKIEELSGKSYKESDLSKTNMRILADHIRTAVFMAMDGVKPSNKDQGYMLRRVLRRMVRAAKNLGIDKDVSVNLVEVVGNNFSWIYPQINEKRKEIERIFGQEEAKFRKVLEKGSRTAEKQLENFDGNNEDLANLAFDLYQSVGYPAEIFEQDVKEFGLELDTKLVEEKIEHHKELSRKGAEQKFAGGLADTAHETIKYHTATHLLHWALREVLGKTVVQQGSNITGERLRFDVSFNRKMTDEELQKVQDMINEKVNLEIPVGFEQLSAKEAEKTGALHFFGEKYGDTVNVYYIGDDIGTAFSKEYCGGPHVNNTADIGEIEIFKQKKIGENVLRIYAKSK